MENCYRLEVMTYLLDLGNGETAVLAENKGSSALAGHDLPGLGSARLRAPKRTECRYYSVCSGFAANPRRYLEEAPAPGLRPLPLMIDFWTCGFCPRSADRPPPEERLEWIEIQDREYRAHLAQNKRLVRRRPHQALCQPAQKIAGNAEAARRPSFAGGGASDGHGYEIRLPDESVIGLCAENRQQAILAAGRRLTRDQAECRLFAISEDGSAKEVNFKFAYYKWIFFGNEPVKGKVSFVELCYRGKIHALGPLGTPRELYGKLKRIIGRDINGAELRAIQEKRTLPLSLCYYQDHIARFFAVISNTRYPLGANDRGSAIASARNMARLSGWTGKIELIERLSGGSLKREII